MQFFSKQDCPVVPTHILLLNMKVVVTQSCLTLCNPMDCSLPSSSVQGILQARILESVDTAFSRGIFLTQGSNLGLLHCRQILYHLRHPENTVFFLNRETSRLCLDSAAGTLQPRAQALWGLTSGNTPYTSCFPVSENCSFLNVSVFSIVSGRRVSLGSASPSELKLEVVRAGFLKTFREAILSLTWLRGFPLTCAWYTC